MYVALAATRLLGCEPRNGDAVKFRAASWVAAVALTLTGCSGSPTSIQSGAAGRRAVIRTTAAVSTVPLPTTTVSIPVTTTTTTTTTSSTSSTVPATDTQTVSLETPPRSEVEFVICHPRWEWDCTEALAVSWCESWHRPWSVSSPNRDGTRDRGVFQVNDVWEEAWSPQVWANILDLETNVAMAHHIWKTGNDSWLYWTCQP